MFEYISNQLSKLRQWIYEDETGGDMPKLVESKCIDTPILFLMYPREDYVGGYKIPIYRKDFPNTLNKDPEKVRLLVDDDGEIPKLDLPYTCDCCTSHRSNIELTAQKEYRLQTLSRTIHNPAEYDAIYICAGCAIAMEELIIQDLYTNKPEYLIGHAV